MLSSVKENVTLSSSEKVNLRVWRTPLSVCENEWRFFLIQIQNGCDKTFLSFKRQILWFSDDWCNRAATKSVLRFFLNFRRRTFPSTVVVRLSETQPLVIKVSFNLATLYEKSTLNFRSLAIVNKRKKELLSHVRCRPAVLSLNYISCSPKHFLILLRFF